MTDCPLCKEPETRDFFELRAMPVLIGTLFQSATDARNCGVGDLLLVFCPSCGFIWNRSFDPALLEYSETYENSLHFSDVFQRYTQGIVDRLIEAYDIRGKDVVDLGCGKGDFLAMLCEAGGNRGVGFDPTYAGDRIEGEVADRLTFIRDLYSEAYSAAYPADLMTSRYVLEHVPDPLTFLDAVRRAISSDRRTIVYFEVPDVRLILEQLSVWDVIYEHCSYFGIESLAAAFRHGGFTVLDVRQAYDGQFVAVEATPGPPAQQSFGDLAALAHEVDRFQVEFRRRIETWQERLAVIRSGGQRVVAWGAGAKAVGFLNMLNIRDEVPYVVDINPHKKGSFLAGTGQEVVAPEFLLDYRPDQVILMNPIYEREIEEQLAKLGISTHLVGVDQ
jgi:SAM-dependent methyltransferase